MADQVNGRQKILAEEYDTYDHWRKYALTHGVNVDFSYGNQCWDICCFLWIQYGLFLYTGPRGYAYECYAVSKDRNAVFPFSKVGTDDQSAMERKKLIKRGDCLVFFASGLNYTGHICFADEDYNGTDTLKCLGQNQGQGISWGTPSNIKSLNLRSFMGAFRNKNWVIPEPAIKYKPSKHRFPWAIYARKFRGGIR
jgi:hypothetical protein